MGRDAQLASGEEGEGRAGLCSGIGLGIVRQFILGKFFWGNLSRGNAWGMSG